ncbi:hypothetical protein [Microtetraspora malaysiensis]|uniref:hypothetical protein n=1 Tax=Microtetraspora malaysiensis TaxID=161358 RepID=UPI000829F6B3|nr:hypothetical protein [Microtetraspora malaysiensis]
MTTVELARFHVVPEHVERPLAARPAMLADFRAGRPSFPGVRLVRPPGDQWLDIVHWQTPEDFSSSRAEGANLPGIKAFFDAIDHVASAEEGTTIEDEDER